MVGLKAVRLENDWVVKLDVKMADCSALTMVVQLAVLLE